MKVLSIDAWRDGDGWQWNNWFNAGEFPNASADMLDKPRALLRWFREAGYLSEGSRGRVAIDDDGYNVVILDRGTREPLYALEYGAVETAHFVLRTISRGVVGFDSDIGFSGANPNTTPAKLARYLRELHADKIVSIEVLQ
jgi:hypothetical protein